MQKMSNQSIQWMQSHSGHSAHWMQRMQCTVDAVHSGHSRIVVYGSGDIVLWCKKVKPVDAVDAVCSGLAVYGGGDIVLWCKKSNQWMQYAVDAVE